MDKRLDCEIVRDLLPSYADALTGATTSRAVDEHLAGCRECSEALRRMKEPEPAENAPAPEVDYLKKLRRRSLTTALLCALAALLLALAVCYIRFYIVGDELSTDSYDYSVSVTNDTVVLSLSRPYNEGHFTRVLFDEKDGVVTARVFGSPKNVFQDDDSVARYTAREAVFTVLVGGRAAWDRGLKISAVTGRLYSALNPYAGDMPANERVASALGLAGRFGPYTSELQTSAEPYGWTLRLEAVINQNDESAAREDMTGYSYAILAAVGNLSRVTWEYETTAGSGSLSVTAQEASDFAGKDIKLCSQSPSELQALLRRMRSEE